LSQDPQGTALDQAIASLRNNIILGHSKSEELSLNAYDKVVMLLQQQGTKLTESQKEIQRLQELCNQNKIDYKPKEEKSSK